MLSVCWMNTAWEKKWRYVTCVFKLILCRSYCCGSLWNETMINMIHIICIIFFKFWAVCWTKQGFLIRNHYQQATPICVKIHYKEQNHYTTFTIQPHAHKKWHKAMPYAPCHVTLQPLCKGFRYSHLFDCTSWVIWQTLCGHRLKSPGWGRLAEHSLMSISYTDAVRFNQA